MRCAGMVETGDPQSIQRVDEIVYSARPEAWMETLAQIAFSNRADA